jgi:hypothetical protein
MARVYKVLTLTSNTEATPLSARQHQVTEAQSFDRDPPLNRSTTIDDAISLIAGLGLSALARDLGFDRPAALCACTNNVRIVARSLNPTMEH